jgi:hypothetical protein
VTTHLSPLDWQRSKRCGDGACVEAAALGDEIFVRDSKDPQGPVLRFTLREWEAFIGGIEDGDFRFSN